MPVPRSVARFNRKVTNHLLGPLATRLPLFGMITHVGRKSGRQYRTPVNVFRRQSSYVIALIYGPEADWVRNVMASGGCTLETRGQTIQLGQPRLFHDETRRLMPLPVRWVLGRADVSDFLELKPATKSAAAGPVPCAGGA